MAHTRMNNKVKAENLTWLFLTVCVRMYAGFETRGGSLFLPLDTGALKITLNSGAVHLRNLQGDTVRTVDYPKSSGPKWQNIREFVPTVFDGLVPVSYLRDIDRLCKHFNPSRFYLLEKEGLYLQNSLTNTWGKGKTSALRVSMYDRHEIVDWLIENQIEVEKIKWIGVDTNPRKNKFGEEY